jgi:hypothetical protein
VKASADNLADYLGVPRYRYGEVEDKDLIGVVTELAPEPIEWDETTTTAGAVPEEATVEEEASTLTAHRTIATQIPGGNRQRAPTSVTAIE